MTNREEDSRDLISIAMKKEDMAEFERVKHDIIMVLEKLGGYEAAVDDMYVDQAVRAIIYTKKSEAFLDADLATEDTYSKITDTKLKLWRILEEAVGKLALSRRDRIGNRTQADIEKQLKEALVRGLKSAGK